MAIVAVASAVAQIAASATSVYNSFKSVLGGGTSPRVEWDEANAVSYPTARDLTTALEDKLGTPGLAKVFPLYVAKLKGYIASSAHSDAGARALYVNALETEAVQMQGGFKLDAFPFDTVSTDQFAWALWLHAMWLYGNVSKDEVPNGNALRKFQESLEPTLSAAIYEATGQTVEVGKTGNVFGPGSVPDTSAGSTTTKKAAAGTSTFTMVLLVGAAIGLIYFSAKAARTGSKT